MIKKSADLEIISFSNQPFKLLNG